MFRSNVEPPILGYEINGILKLSHYFKVYYSESEKIFFGFFYYKIFTSEITNNFVTKIADLHSFRIFRECSSLVHVEVLLWGVPHQTMKLDF